MTLYVGIFEIKSDIHKNGVDLFLCFHLCIFLVCKSIILFLIYNVRMKKIWIKMDANRSIVNST